jgi:glycosyltransferase involved in cell wall biosynthesis
MKVTHVITGLNDGGAEGVLFRLCNYDKENIHNVICLTALGRYGPLLRAKGVDVLALNMKRSFPSPLAFLRLVLYLRAYKPEIVQTWMYHADFFGGCAARIAGIKSVVWGIRSSILVSQHSKQATIIVSRLLSLLSYWIPCRIVVCAQKAMDVHVTIGYDRKKMRVIFNGYEIVNSNFQEDSRQNLRKSLGIKFSTKLIGMVARFDPYKDHSNLLHAVSILCKKGINLKCVLVGAGIETKNECLRNLIAKLSLNDVVFLLGQRDDIPTIMGSIDLHILSSFAEGFPNVVAEAMACGTPAVVTDVGDAALIVGDTGWVVPPRNSLALATAIEIALHETSDPAWRTRCNAVRSRIRYNFGIDQMIENYQRIWNEAKSVCVE